MGAKNNNLLNLFVHMWENAMSIISYTVAPVSSIICVYKIKTGFVHLVQMYNSTTAKLKPLLKLSNSTSLYQGHKCIFYCTDISKNSL